MRRAILPHQSCTIQTQHHVQPHRRRIVNDVIVSPLHKRRVDVAERQQPVLRHPTRESHRMPLSNAHIKYTLRHRIHHDIHRTARRHGRRHTHNLRILLRQLQQCLSKHLLKLRRMRLAIIILNALPRVGVKLARSMPDGGILFGRCIAITFRRMDIEQFRSLHLLDHLQNAHQFHHIIPLGRTKIADVHPLKNILLTRQHRLQTVAETNQSPATLLVQNTPAQQPLRHPVPNSIISRVRCQSQEILSHAPHTAVNRHIVVVQHNQHVIRRARRVVDALKSQAATHRPVTNHHLPILTLHLRSHRHAQSRRDGIARMPATKRVILALVGMRKRLQSVQLTVRAEQVTTPRQNLMPIRLMPHIPHNTVVWCVKNVMQRHRQLHHTQARSQMTRILSQLLNDVAPQLITHRRQFLHLQFTQVNRVINLP